MNLWGRLPYRRHFIQLPGPNADAFEARKARNWSPLPFWVRATYEMLQEIVDDGGRVAVDENDPWSTVSSLVGAHPLERRQLRRCLDALSVAGVLFVQREGDKTYLVLTNFIPEQIECRRDLYRQSEEPGTVHGGSDEAQVEFGCDVSARNQTGRGVRTRAKPQQQQRSASCNVSARNQTVGVVQEREPEQPDSEKLGCDVSARNQTVGVVQDEVVGQLARARGLGQPVEFTGGAPVEERVKIREERRCRDSEPRQPHLAGIDAGEVGPTARQRVIDHWFTRYRDRMGCSPPFAAAEARAVAELLRKFDEDVGRICEVIDNAFANTWFVRTCADIKVLAKNPNPYVRQAVRRRQPGPDNQSDLFKR